MKQLFLLIFIALSCAAAAQNRTVTRKVIDMELQRLWGVRIQLTDKRTMGETDTNGAFRIEIPSNADSLVFLGIGLEPSTIKLAPGCDYIELIMLPRGTYHYTSHQKIDKERKTLFDKIPGLYAMAFDKGIFTSRTPCYSRNFQPDKPALDAISRELKMEQKETKALFKRLKIGDTVQIPFSGSYRSDGTDRTTLTPWSYFTDATQSSCLLEGIITHKDRRQSGYNIEVRITDCTRCTFKTPIVYRDEEVKVGTVFRHNMKILKVVAR